jgi:hypothetical protein
MKKTLGITLAVAFAISAVAAPVMGASEKAQGKGLVIQQACGAPYGQLVSAVKAGKIEHPPIEVRGIPALLEAIPAGHCGA